MGYSICIICINYSRNIKKTIYDVCEKRNRNICDIMTELNIKIPNEEDCIPKYICEDCYVNLLQLYRFRNNCCILFTSEIFSKVRKCKVCNNPYSVHSFIENCEILGYSANILTALSKICSYDLEVVFEKENIAEKYLCDKCYQNLKTNYEFFQKCKTAEELWTSYVFEHYDPPENVKYSLHAIYRQFSTTCVLEDRFVHKSALLKNGSMIIKVESTKEPKLYQCNICSKKFTQLGSVQIHKRNIHGCHGERTHKCNICFKMFKQKTTLIEHLLIHTGAKLFKCSTCGKTFKTNYQLKRHLIVHTDAKPYKCNKCSKGYSVASSLKLHLTTHTKRNFKCEYCDKRFYLRSVLNNHLLSHKEKPFKCRVCGKGFPLQVRLDKHFVWHSNERPFKCDQCSKRFKSKSNLNKHLIIHTNERPHKCSICSKGFSQSVTLKQHLAIHSDDRPFGCDQCSKAFKLKIHLIEHLSVHNARKAFKCKVCSSSFNEKRRLTRHMVRHTDAKWRFKCKQCMMMYSSKCSLENHVKRKHTMT